MFCSKNHLQGWGTGLVLHSSNVNLKSETSSNNWNSNTLEYFTFPEVILNQVQIKTGTKALLHI